MTRNRKFATGVQSGDGEPDPIVLPVMVIDADLGFVERQGKDPYRTMLCSLVGMGLDIGNCKSAITAVRPSDGEINLERWAG